MAARTAGNQQDDRGQWVEIASGPVPHIHPGLCTACGLCVVVCPYGAIAVAWDRDGAMLPWIDERRCMRCDECERACPERAVEVPFEVVLQERSRT
jgi:formate hydrogenlyase subunit 6/NADH:ubiquinone oxidoreductase subunit I